MPWTSPPPPSTEVLKSPEGETRKSRRNVFSFSLIHGRFSHRCLSMTTIAAIEWPMAVAVCLVAQRAKSVVQCSLEAPSGDNPYPSPSFWAGRLGTPATPPLCAGHHQPDPLSHTPCRKVIWHSFDGKTRAFNENTLLWEIASQCLFYRGHFHIPLLTQSLHIRIIWMLCVTSWTAFCQ